MSAAPIGAPGCPDFAFSTASADRNLIVLTESWARSTDVVGMGLLGCSISGTGTLSIRCYYRLWQPFVGTTQAIGDLPMPSRLHPVPLLLAAAVAAALAGTGCATNPATGKRQISFVSTSKEAQMGRESDPAVIEQYGIYGDSIVDRYVDSVGQKLASVSPLPNLGWHFRVIDSPVVNAFAILGGYIYVSRGILPYLNSEAQLAGVLGHEIGHVTARHSAEQITRSQIATVGLLASMFVSALRPYTAVASQGLGLLFLRYSRENETQADELGVGYTTRAGYDSRVIPSTYTMLKRVGERQGDQLPGFLSTHPDPGDREIRTAQLAQAAVAGGKRGLEIGAERY